MKNFPHFLLISSLALLSTLAVLLGTALAQNPNQDYSSASGIFRYSDKTEIDGGYSRLIRTNDSVAIELATSELTPNAPHTIWWVVFNNPEACTVACDGDDIFAEDGTLNLNEEASISILFADGAISDTEGKGSFSALLPEGRPLGQVLVGPGLTNVAKAEIHLVVRTHGELDPSRVYAQLSTGGNDCADCYKEDIQFAVHTALETN